MRGGHNKAAIDEERLRREYLARRPVAEIAAEYRVTIQCIYARLRAIGITRSNSEAHRGLQIGPRNPQWKGGRRVGSNGYVWIRVGGRDVLEHRHVMAQHLGRALRRGEVVHHRNGNGRDNRIENLDLLPSQSEHMREHMTPDVARAKGRRGLESRYARRAALKAVQP